MHSSAYGLASGVFLFLLTRNDSQLFNDGFLCWGFLGLLHFPASIFDVGFAVDITTRTRTHLRRVLLFFSSLSEHWGRKLGGALWRFSGGPFFSCRVGPIHHHRHHHHHHHPSGRRPKFFDSKSPTFWVSHTTQQQHTQSWHARRKGPGRRTAGHGRGEKGRLGLGGNKHIFIWPTARRRVGLKHHYHHTRGEHRFVGTDLLFSAIRDPFWSSGQRDGGRVSFFSPFFCVFSFRQTSSGRRGWTD